LKERIMLVLTRRVGEEIVIANNIRVKVVAVTGQRIRLGITAPPVVHVARAELRAQRTYGRNPMRVSGQLANPEAAVQDTSSHDEM
jgi:carbon storage regulator